MATTPSDASAARTGRLRVGRNVVFLGLNSLVTDVSAEMVTAVLPLYLVFHLRMSALQLGMVDGLYQGVMSATWPSRFPWAGWRIVWGGSRCC
jgi:hypothetical protein